MSEEKDSLDKLLPQAKKADYRSSKRDGRRGKFVVVAGESDVGKTYFIASAPDPIVIIDMDDGTEAIGMQYDEELDEEYEGLFPDKDIRVIHVDMDSSLDKSKIKNKEVEFSTTLVNALVNLKRAIGAVKKALDNGANIGTIAFETATWLWMAAMDWMKYKVLEIDEETKAYVNQAFDWAVAQKEYRRVFMGLKKLRRYGCNVIITAHTKNEYNNKMEIIGEKIHWWSQSIKMTDTILWIRAESKKVGRKIVTERVARFERLRGVENAKKISKPIIDITWDKFIAELSRIRRVESTTEDDSSSKYKLDDKEDKPKQKGRRRRVPIE